MGTKTPVLSYDNWKHNLTSPTQNITLIAMNVQGCCYTQKVQVKKRIKRGNTMMDAIIGRYRVRMEEMGLILKHTSGISFDLTPDETLNLLDFINAYRQTLLMMQQESNQDTEPELERIIIRKNEDEE